jgi:AraC-like DNA-binding protein
MRNLALRLALETPIGAYPLLDYLVLSSDTVGGAFRQLARYLGLVGSPIVFAFHDEKDPFRVVLSCPGNVFAVEYSVLLSVIHMRRETGGEVAASIHFSHRPDDVDEIEQRLQCPVRANDGWDGLSIPRSSWTRRLPRRDPVLHALLERQADDAAERLNAPQDTRSRLRHLLVGRLTTGDVRIESAARELGTTPRTLQRRLADAGTTYQELLEEIRREAAAGYMQQSDLSAGQVGYLLGYSEPAAFHRAFKKWFGVTPLEFRRRTAGPRPRGSG